MIPKTPEESTNHSCAEKMSERERKKEKILFAAYFLCSEFFVMKKK